MQEYRAEHPDLDHVPDEKIEKLLDYQGWRVGRNLDEVGRILFGCLRDIPLIGRLFRWTEPRKEAGAAERVSRLRSPGSDR